MKHEPELPPAPSRVTGNTERVLGWTALLYGLTILNPWTQVFVGYQAYAVMARTGTELTWGTSMTALGLFQLLAIKASHHWPRKVAALMAAALWGFMAWLFFLGRLRGWEPRMVFDAATSPGVLLFLLWGYYQGITGFRLKR